MKQNDKRLSAKINRLGCFFIACSLCAERALHVTYDADTINKTWDEAVKRGLIDKNDNVMNSAGIMNLFVEKANRNGRFYEVGLIKGGRPEFYPSVSGKFRAGDFFIQKIVQGGASVTHFRVVDKDERLVEDPHDPPIKPIKVLYTIVYRFVS